MKRTLLPIALLAILTGCSQAPAPAVDNREADSRSLRAAEEAAIIAFSSKDGDRMIAAYSSDANLMLSNSPVLTGEDLRAAIKALAADPNFSMQFHTDRVETAKSGEIGYTRGAYTLTMTDPKTKRVLSEKGKYVTVYAKQADGSWKIIEDISNPDAPAIPVAAAK